MKFCTHFCKLFVTICVLFCVISCSKKLEDSTFYLYTPRIINDSSVDSWNKFTQDLLNTNSKYITIYLTGDGGYNHLLPNIVDSLLRAKVQGKIITVEAVEFIGSLHVVISCYADKIKYRQNVKVVVHSTAINTIVEKNNKKFLYLNQTPESENRVTWNQCKSVGVVSEKDFEDMNNYKEITYIYNSNGTVKDRIVNKRIMRFELLD